jgi:hypothetical protein
VKYSIQTSSIPGRLTTMKRLSLILVLLIPSEGCRSTAYPRLDLDLKQAKIPRPLGSRTAVG